MVKIWSDLVKYLSPTVKIIKLLLLERKLNELFVNVIEKKLLAALSLTICIRIDMGMQRNLIKKINVSWQLLKHFQSFFFN